MRHIRDDTREPGESISHLAAWAKDMMEPAFYEYPIFEDTRGWSVMNMMQGHMDGGQLNYSEIRAGAVKAWHAHAHQTDFWFCTSGTILVGILRIVPGKIDPIIWRKVLSNKRPGILIIPPKLWHGYRALDCLGSAGLLYYVDREYDTKNPDESRKGWNHFEIFDWSILNG